MSSKRSVGSVDGDILTSVWEWARELESESGHACRFALTPTERKGVWHVRAQVASVVDGRAISIVLQREGVWPNSQAVTLVGQLFKLQIELSELYDQLRGKPMGL